MKVLVGGQLIEYKDEGKGKVLLLLHGWGANLGSFNDLAKHLSKKYRVIRFDFPGYGASPQPSTDWYIGDYAKLTSELLKKLKIEKLHAVVGHSFGGRVIIKMSALGLLATQKVILLGAAGIKPKQTPKKALYRMIAKTGKAATSLPGLKKVRASLREKFYVAIGSTDYLRSESMQQIFLHTVNEDLLPFVKTVKQPSLLIWGENDDQTPVGDAYRMLNELEDAELFVVEDAGHFVYLDDPEIVYTKIEGFLK